MLTFNYFPNIPAVAFLPPRFVLWSYFPRPSCLSTLQHFSLPRSSFLSLSAVSYLLFSFLKPSFSISFISPSYCHFSYGIFATAEIGLVFPPILPTLPDLSWVWQIIYIRFPQRRIGFPPSATGIGYYLCYKYMLRRPSGMKLEVSFCV